MWSEDKASTPPSNALYSAIVATVAAETKRRLTVRELADRLGTDAQIAAHCIALHSYFRHHTEDRLYLGTLEFPLPPDLTVLDEDALVDEAALGIDTRSAA